MKSRDESRTGWHLITGIILGVLALTAGPAFAALTFGGTSISGDGAVAIDGSSTISIGTSMATGITIGKVNATTTFAGNALVAGHTAIGAQATLNQSVFSELGGFAGVSTIYENTTSSGSDGVSGLNVELNALPPADNIFQYSGAQVGVGLEASNTRPVQNLYALYNAAYDYGTGDITATLLGVQADCEKLGHGGTVNNIACYYSNTPYVEAGAHANNMFHFWALPAQVNGTADNVYGTYISAPSIGGGGSITNTFDYWGSDLAGVASNTYYSWFDSRGVRRVKEDSSINGSGQAVEALYNNQFTKYTPGAANYERLVLGEWNGSNVAEIGTENGGTGSARALAFITASTTRMTIGPTGNVGIGTSTPATALQVATVSSTIRIGDSALPGCIEVGNSNGSAGINYVTFLNGVMTATTTKPSNCQ